LRAVPREGGASDDDREIAQGLAAGEAWAATAAWNKHSPMVFGFLQRAIGPDGDVEDLTQEVFLRVFSKARELRDSGALRSFVFSVAVRTLKWQLRRRRVRRILQLTSHGETPESAAPAPDAESRQALRRFYAILDRLSAGDRAAFALRHIEGMKLEEVGDALRISVATVKRRLYRATRTVTQLVDSDPSLAPYAGRNGMGA
jgi:RNA polymerase sigma-70 factor (ECF subfamily)